MLKAEESQRERAPLCPKQTVAFGPDVATASLTLFGLRRLGEGLGKRGCSPELWTPYRREV